MSWQREDERVLDYLKARVDLFGQKIGKEVHDPGGLQYNCNCPICGKKKHFYISAETSMWDCKACGETGNLLTLKRTLGDVKEIQGPSGERGGRGSRNNEQVVFFDVTKGALTKSPKRRPDPGHAEEAHERLMRRADPEAIAAWAWLTDPAGQRGYTEETIRHFRLGVAQLECYGDGSVREKKSGGGGSLQASGGRRARSGGSGGADHNKDGEGEGGKCALCGGRTLVSHVTIPFYVNGVCVNIKYRSLPAWPKHWRRFVGGESVFLDLDRLQLSPGEDGSPVPPLTLVEGEWDAMAMHQMGFGNVTTVPTGAGSRLRDEWDQLLAKVPTVLICYDQDGAGRSGAERMSVDLGRHRCWLVQLPGKDANACMVAGLSDEVGEAFRNARPYAPSALVSSSSLKEDIWQDIHNPERYYGISTGWSSIDALWGGVRPELTIVTGHSGSGKSTFVTGMAANMAEGGFPGLVCPFELRVKPSILKVLRRLTGCDVATEEGLSKWDDAWEILEGWPIYWLNHYGSISLVALSETLKYAVTRLGIRWVVLDHLDFFVLPERGEDEWQATRRALKMLSELAEELGLAIILVVHPNSKPEDETVRVRMTDLRGGSAVWQIPATIISVHVPRTATRKEVRHKNKETGKMEAAGPCSIISLLKVRSDVGKEGQAVLDYDIRTTTYSDPSDGASFEGGGEAEAEADAGRQLEIDKHGDAWAENERAKPAPTGPAPTGRRARK